MVVIKVPGFRVAEVEGCIHWRLEHCTCVIFVKVLVLQNNPT